jgi:hypothetical protein
MKAIKKPTRQASIGHLENLLETIRMDIRAAEDATELGINHGLSSRPWETRNRANKLTSYATELEFAVQWLNHYEAISK